MAACQLEREELPAATPAIKGVTLNTVWNFTHEHNALKGLHRGMT